jgi:hypothetical protein
MIDENRSRPETDARSIFNPAAANIEPDREPLIDAGAVAKRLNVSKSWVLAHASGARRPILKNIKLGKRVLFRPRDVDEFLRQYERC